MKVKRAQKFWREKFLHISINCCDRCGQIIKDSAAILYYPKIKVVKVICNDCENLLVAESLKHNVM